MFVEALISGKLPFITGLSKEPSLFPSNKVEINLRVSGLSPLCSESQNGGLPGVLGPAGLFHGIHLNPHSISGHQQAGGAHTDSSLHFQCTGTEQEAEKHINWLKLKAAC